MADLANPPKYSGPGPQTLADWVSFWRWLISLWSVARESINAQESITISPRPSRYSDQETLGAAQAFMEARPGAVRQPEPDAAAMAAFQRLSQKTLDVEELRALTWMSLMRVPYPAPAGLVVLDLTLGAASTTVSPPSGGTDFLVILRQDVAGARAVVWGAGIVGASVNIDTTPSTISTFRFVYSAANNQWVMVGQPTTGMAV